MQTLIDRKRVTYVGGRSGWKYRGKKPNGITTNWLTEEEVLKSFTPLQLDVFHALWNLYFLTRATAQLTSARKCPVPLSRAEALRFCPLGTLIEKSHGRRVIQGQVYGHSGRYWGIRYQDGDWEELSLREMKRYAKKAQGVATPKTSGGR